VTNVAATTYYTALDVLTVSGCNTGGYTLTEWKTAVANGATYAAASVLFPLTEATGVITGTFTFEGLVPATLSPNEQVTFVLARGLVEVSCHGLKMLKTSPVSLNSTKV
jgi:hypothetical protein